MHKDYFFYQFREVLKKLKKLFTFIYFCDIIHFSFTQSMRNTIRMFGDLQWTSRSVLNFY